MYLLMLENLKVLNYRKRWKYGVGFMIFFLILKQEPDFFDYKSFCTFDFGVLKFVFISTECKKILKLSFENSKLKVQMKLKNVYIDGEITTHRKTLNDSETQYIVHSFFYFFTLQYCIGFSIH